MNSQYVYLATICWDGYDEYTEGEYTVIRHTLNDLFEGIKEYLHTYKSRDPYLECASIETYKDDSSVPVSYKDITESTKTIIKVKEKDAKSRCN